MRHLFHFVHRQLALKNRKEARFFDLDQGFFYLRMVKIATMLEILNVVATDQYLEFCREVLNEEDAT